MCYVIHCYSFCREKFSYVNQLLQKQNAALKVNVAEMLFLIGTVILDSVLPT